MADLQTTRYCLTNPVPEPTPADGTILHFVPDVDSEHFVEFSQDCSSYLPIKRFHDDTQSLDWIGVGVMRANVPVMITYVSALGYYVLGGLPDNNQFAGWHETGQAVAIGPGTAKMHYKSFGLNLDVDFAGLPRTDSVHVIHNGSTSGTITVKFGSTLSGVEAVEKDQPVSADMVLDPGDLLHMVGTGDDKWRIVEHLIDASGGTPGGGGGSYTPSDWPVIRNSIDVGESHTIPDRFQMIVNETMQVDGTLNIEGTGELIVLDDVPDPISPDFTYTADVLTRIDYAGGEYKTFTYGGGGELTVVDYVNGGVTTRKEFFYGVGGELDYITQTYL